MNRTWRSLYIYIYNIKRENSTRRRDEDSKTRKKKKRGRKIFFSRDRIKKIHTHTHTHARTEDLSIDATRTDIERSWLPRTMEIIRACFCARNGHKLRQPIGTPVDQCQELVFIGKRKIRSLVGVPFLIPFLIVSLPPRKIERLTEPISTFFCPPTVYRSRAADL